MRLWPARLRPDCFSYFPAPRQFSLVHHVIDSETRQPATGIDNGMDRSILPSHLRVRLLPSSIGAGPPRQFLTTFLVDDSLAVDAGSLAFALTAEEMRQVQDILITHAHVDHTASLPIFVSEAFAKLTSPIAVHAIPKVIDALRRFVFNGEIWPDFTRISMPNSQAPALEFRPLEIGTSTLAGHFRVTPVLVNHVVPTSGFLVEAGHSGFAFTSDTYATDEIWEKACRLERIRTIFVDVSYPNEMEDLAATSKHFTPRSLAADLRKLTRDIAIRAVHVKPAYREAVLRQLAELRDPRVSVVEIGRTYEL